MKMLKKSTISSLIRVVAGVLRDIHRSDLSLDANGRVVQHTDTILNGYDVPARPNLFAGSASC